jgi:hypothetical protein
VKSLVEEHRTGDAVLAALEGRGFPLSEEFKEAARLLVGRVQGPQAGGAVLDADRDR